jgi:hypothetical protein
MFMKCEGLERAIDVLGVEVRITKVCGGLVYFSIHKAKAADHYLINLPDQRREIHRGTVSTGADQYL